MSSASLKFKIQNLIFKIALEFSFNSMACSLHKDISQGDEILEGNIMSFANIKY
ncbi:MAG: hypothetical protein IPP69_00990 [Flavobacteriales bacterium]|nr:hypothetical protein [Flavobacteriales bacterium]